MQISQLDPKQAEKFSSTHAIHYKLSDGRQMVLLSGIVSVDLKSPGWANENTSPGWFIQNLSLNISLPADMLQDGQSFRLVESVPFLSINAMAGFSNVGWAVNSFELTMQDSAINSIQLKTELGVLNSGETLNRLGYHISLIGELVN
ncbi:hypothetical protein KQ298_08550 [Synechococcus sp. CS-1330]|nr:hypothetical protein [Synechococcus sp. CS-1330]